MLGFGDTQGPSISLLTVLYGYYRAEIPNFQPSVNEIAHIAVLLIKTWILFIDYCSVNIISG
jgi:hypothetical protein